jgi:hypothetical protein
MTRIALVVAAFAHAATGAGTAGAAPPTAAQVAKLTAEVTALQKQVKALQAQVKKDESTVTAGFTYFAGYEICQTALVTDALQGTWGIVDQLLVASGKPAAWGPQAAVNDFTACAAISRNAIVHGITTPSGVTNLSALIALLNG